MFTLTQKVKAIGLFTCESFILTDDDGFEPEEAADGIERASREGGPDRLAIVDDVPEEHPGLVLSIPGDDLAVATDALPPPALMRSTAARPRP